MTNKTMKIKKYTTIAAALAVIITLTGCGTEGEKSSTPQSSVSNTNSGANGANSSNSTSASGNSNTSTPKTESNIKMISHELSKDYQGKDALVIEYEWTNTGDKEANFMTTFTAQVYQNGIECESAIGVDGVDTQNQMNDIQPGITYKLKKAFVLQDKTTANVVVKSLFGSDNLIDEKIDLGGGEGTSVPSGEISETSLKIKDHKISTDYKGNKVLVVNYEFYNGEDSAKGFSFMFTDKAFQNGVECDNMVIDCDDVDAQTQLNDVQPGYSYIVSEGYHIDDEKTDVQIKVTDLFGTKTYLNETIKLS